MNIIVRGRNVAVSDFLEAHCRERVMRAVQPFAQRVVRVETVLANLNALHNAPRHACRVFVTLASGERLMFVHSDRDHYRAVTQAASGAGRHLARVLHKRRTTGRMRIEPLDAA